MIPPGAVITPNNRAYPLPSPELKKGFEDLVKQGKGLVFLHHANAAWAHVWPEYSEIIGGACDWFAPLGTIRGLDYPRSGAFGNNQRVTVVDKTHPLCSASVTVSPNSSAGATALRAEALADAGLPLLQPATTIIVTSRIVVLAPVRARWDANRIALPLSTVPRSRNPKATRDPRPIRIVSGPHAAD